MKRHLTYIMFGTTLLLVYCLFWVNLYVYASDVPYIAFISNRDWNYDIYIMDIKGKNLQNLTNSPTHDLQRFRRTDSGWLMFPLGMKGWKFM